MKSNINIKRVIIVFFVIDFVLCLGIVIGMHISQDKPGSPVATLVSERSITLGESKSKAAIYENFQNYVKKSYILIGSEPNVTYYKILRNVPRNDYDTESFYCDSEDDFIYYHDKDGVRSSVIAVDVSSYQPALDWNSLKAAGVEVAMIRVGYRGYGNGALVTDAMFDTHIRGALNAGLRVGVYFYTQAVNYEEGAEEARYVLDIISRYDVTCPVTIDTEYLPDESARAYDLDVDTRTDAVVGFCETVKEAGYTPMVYSNRNWFVQNLDMSRLGGYKIWVAHYTNEPDFPYMYTGWQYTDQGALDGAANAIDLNVWFE